MFMLICFVVNSVSLGYKNFKIPQQIAGKIRFLIQFNFLFGNLCLLQLLCFHCKLTASYIYCFFVFQSVLW